MFDAEHLKKLNDTGKCVGGQLTGVDLSGADLSGVNLNGSDLSEARLPKVNFTQTSVVLLLQILSLCPWNLDLNSDQFGGNQQKNKKTIRQTF